jgi:hypothetical protein
MAWNNANSMQNTRGTTAAFFTPNGTYSSMIELGGGNLVGVFSPNWPSNGGTLFIRADIDPNGTGYPAVYSSAKVGNQGTSILLTTWGSGTYFVLDPTLTDAFEYIRFAVGTAGTAGIAAGGTIYCITRV